MSAFETLGVIPELIAAVQEMDWNLPTQVQDEAIPLILGGGDVMVAAETGSGKTGAFCLPILQLIYETLRGEADTSSASEAKPSFLDASGRPICVMNPDARDKVFAISSDGGLLCQSRDAQWAGGKASVGLVKGKFYWECTVTDEGLCRIGVSTTAGTYNLGTDKCSFGYGGTGKKSFANTFADYGEAFGLNDVIGVFLDLDNFTISFSKNGKLLGEAFSIPKEIRGHAFYPATVLKNAELLFNFGATPFANADIKGFRAVTDADVKETNLGMSAEQQGQEEKSAGKKKAFNTKSPLALILEPVRELADQVNKEIEKFKGCLQSPPISHSLLIGGGTQKETGKLMHALKDGCNIVIGTPGIVMSMVKQGTLDISKCRFLVIDEADQMIETGGDVDITNLYNTMTRNDNKVQTIICSATLHSAEIAAISNKICKNPTWVDLKGKDSIPEGVDHAIVVVDPATDRAWEEEKDTQTDNIHQIQGISKLGSTPDHLSQAVKLLKPRVMLEVMNAYNMNQCMIFCRTQLDCDHLELFLNKAGGGPAGKPSFSGKVESGKENKYSCVVLHGGRTQAERKTNLDAFRDGDVRFLICTDVAARGIDIKELPFVINMCLPDKSELYIHRIGRVGRADCRGLAVSIISSVKERVWYHTCNSSDRGRSCKRVELTDKKGCTVWYDEQQSVLDIEKRLGGQKLPHLSRSNLLQGREYVLNLAQSIRKAAPAHEQQSREHVQFVLPRAQELYKTEVTAQKTYLRYGSDYQKKWSDMLKQ